MATNLLRDNWIDLDPPELRLFLEKRVGGPGQLERYSARVSKLHLPLASPSSSIVLIFRDKRIVSIESGRAFDALEWEKISDEVEKSILTGPIKIGREFSFSSFRVEGFWKGKISGVQILPAPANAPRPHVEMAEHPFILEFPMKASDY